MKVIILAGGKGSRLGGDIPKPMVEIGGIPMLTHIMGIYRKYGFNDFVIACGYKGELIREHYKDVDGVTCVDTGLDSGTAERIHICAELAGCPYMLTYGDGVADVNIDELARFGARGIQSITVTAVHAPPRFGELILDGIRVTSFNEKPHDQHDWINGGFFVSYLRPPKEYQSFEFDYLPNIARAGELSAYRHEGNWRCMDTPRDVEYLEQLWQEGRAFWI